MSSLRSTVRGVAEPGAMQASASHAELRADRCQIYRYVLVTSDAVSKIPVRTSGYDRPGLLATCKAIRSEALSIYYRENIFRFAVQDFDSTALYRWDNLLRSIKIDLDSVRCTISMCYPSPSWPNLLVWLRRCHKGEITRGLTELPQSLLDEVRRT